jgi:hypothetical protein
MLEMSPALTGGEHMNDDLYKPQVKQAVILARAYDLVQSVLYKVTARWLFYRRLPSRRAMFARLSPWG